jgi:hypothetical protein
MFVYMTYMIINTTNYSKDLLLQFKSFVTFIIPTI